MNKRLLTVISGFFSLALLILISFQVYWIKQDFRAREELFRGKVDEALINTSTKLERLDNRGDYTQITKTTQGILYPPVTGQAPMNIGMLRTEISTDSNGRQMSIYHHRDLRSDDSLELF